MLNKRLILVGFGMAAAAQSEAVTMNYRCSITPPISHRRSEAQPAAIWTGAALTFANNPNASRLVSKRFTFSVDDNGHLGAGLVHARDGRIMRQLDLTTFRSRSTPERVFQFADTAGGQAQLLPGARTVVQGQGSFEVGFLDQTTNASGVLPIQGNTNWHPEQAIQFESDSATAADLQSRCFNDKTNSGISLCDAARVNFQNAFTTVNNGQRQDGLGAEALRDYYLYIVTRPYANLAHSVPESPWNTGRMTGFPASFAKPAVLFSIVKLESRTIFQSGGLDNLIGGLQYATLKSQALVPVNSGVVELGGLGTSDSDVMGAGLRCEAEEDVAAAVEVTPVAAAPVAAPAVTPTTTAPAVTAPAAQ